MDFKYDFSDFNDHQLNLIAKELLDREYGFSLQVEAKLFGSKEIERIEKVDLIQFVKNERNDYDVVVEVKRYREFRSPNYDNIKDKLNFINEFLDCNQIILFLFDKNPSQVEKLRKDLTHVDKLEVIDMDWIESVLDSEQSIVDKWNLRNNKTESKGKAKELSKEEIEFLSKETEADLNEIKASEKANLLRVSDGILKNLYKKHLHDDEFKFWLRQKDSTRSKEKRLSNGQWFQGSDYIFVGFSGITDQRNRTQTIGFVIVFDGTGNQEYYTELAFPDESRPEFIKCYKDIYSELIESFGGISDQSGKKYQFKIFEDDWENALETFLSKHKPLIDKVIARHGLTNEFEIPESKFKSTLKKSLSIRDDLYPNDPFDQINSIKRSSYNHIPASRRKPVIGVDLLASEIAKFLSSLNGDSAMIVGLFGRWGRGKTFLFNQVWKILKPQDHFIRVDFHAWLHQQTPATWGYLYEVVAKEYYNSTNNWLARQWNTIRLNWKREPKGEFLTIVLSLLFGGTVYITLGLSKWLLGLASLSTLTAFFSLTLKWWKANSTQAKNIYKKYTQRHSFAELMGTQSEVKEELKTLLELWCKEKEQSFKKRILLFVDDIDRCSEDKIIQVIDSLRVILEDPEIAKRLLVVVAVDERILKRAIKIKYEKVLDENDALRMDILIREYLDKLFLAGVKLGDLNQNERAEIFNSMVDGKVSEVEAIKEESEEEVQDLAYTENVNQGIDSLDSNALRSLVTGRTPLIDGSNNESVENEEKINEEPVEETYELSVDEWKELELQFRVMEDLTPRQIRIFYLRYLLGRDFYISVKSNPRWGKKEIKVMLQILAYLFRQDLINKSIKEVLLPKKGTVPINEWRNLSDMEKVKFIEVLDIVVPY